MPSAASGAVASGSTTRRNTRHSDAPSIRAASMSSSGMPDMNWRIMKMPRDVHSPTRMTPPMSSMRPSLPIVMYSGTSSTTNGTNNVETIRPNSRFLPRNRYLAKM